MDGAFEEEEGWEVEGVCRLLLRCDMINDTLIFMGSLRGRNTYKSNLDALYEQYKQDDL